MRLTMEIGKRHRRGAPGVVLALALGLFALGPSAQAAPPNFGFGGLAPGGPGDKIVAFGPHFDVARLFEDGTLDAGFGRRGLARADFPHFTEARALDAVQLRGGAVVLGGYVTTRCQRRRHGQYCARHPALARFDRNGELDTGFDHDGKVVAPFRGGLLALVPLPSGKLLVAGRTGGGLPMLARYTVSGSLDRSYGHDGVVVVRALTEVGRMQVGRADSLVLLPDGDAVASIFAKAPFVRRRGLVRFTRQGRLEPGFGDDGYATTGPSGVRFGEIAEYGLAAMPDGKLLVASMTTVYPAQIALFRLLDDGTVDRTYGDGGVALGLTSFGVRSNVDVALQPDGEALVAAAGFSDSALTRFEPGGTLDRSFGVEGITAPIESWGSHASVVRLADGSIVLADSTRQLSGLLIARYGPGGEPIRTFELPAQD